MKSIKFKILASSLALLIVSILVISVSSIMSLYNSTLYALEHSMLSTIDATADMMEVQLNAYKETAKQFAVDNTLSQPIPAEGQLTADGRTAEQVKAEITAYMEELKILHNFESVQVIDENGDAVSLPINSISESYYTIPRDTGEPYITDPVISPETGMRTLPVSAPIIRDGEFGGVVLFAVNPEVFSAITSKVAVGEGSTVTMINSAGDTIAYNDPQLVFDGFNTIEEAKSDPSLEQLAAVEQNLIDGADGFETVEWDGVSQFVAYTHIDGSNGWGIYILTPQSNFLSQMTSSIITTIILAVIILVIATAITIVVARGIVKPIKLCTERIDMLAKGDLHSPMPEIKTNDETGLLAKSTLTIVTALSAMINDLNYMLSEISSGNFAAESSAKEYYVEDFTSLGHSLDAIIGKLSGTMQQISDVSDQVSSGNNQVAQGAQSLAQGAIEQASSIEQLSSTIEEIAGKIDETAINSQTAKLANDKSQTALNQSNAQMLEMVEAMENISKKSTEISNIIKTIDDIAFQTNILALNAAVEAARAGTAGRGFAVVADEVRSLATKSAQSAKDTATLIEETVAAVKVGSKIATDTSESISDAMQNAAELAKLVDTIALSSSIQAEGAKQVSVGIEEISAVVHTNSATAEESAATSEELSSQSQILNELLSGFVLQGEDSMNSKMMLLGSHENY